MQPIDEILIDNQILPTLLTPTQKEAFAHYLSLAQNNTLHKFETFIQKAARESADVLHELGQVADSILEIISALSRNIDRRLGKDAVFFTNQQSRSDFTDMHLILIKDMQMQVNALASAATRLQNIRRTVLQSIGSPDFITEVTLRYAALCHTATDAPIMPTYREFTQNSTGLTETINKYIQKLEEELSNLEQTVSDFIVSSSRAVTKINKSEQPQSAYLNLLRTEHIQLHNQKAVLNRIKNEVLYVKIPDVL